MEEYNLKYEIDTQRLHVNEWHYFDPKDLGKEDLAEIVEHLLTKETTRNFPCMWQGNYNKRRAQAWIKERDSEAKTLLAVEKETQKPVGYLTFFKIGDIHSETTLNIGYLCSKELWGNGLITELVHGFLKWCEKNEVRTLCASVDFDNIASIRVLEKNNFLTQGQDPSGTRHRFVYHF